MIGIEQIFSIKRRGTINIKAFKPLNAEQTNEKNGKTQNIAVNC